LTIWNSYCLSLAHIVEIRMNSLAVLFWAGSSSSYVSRKLLTIRIAALVHQWQHFILGSNFLSHQWRKLLELALTSANFLDHLNYRLFVFGSHSRTINFAARRRFIFLFFEKAVRNWSLCKFSYHFVCSHGAPAVFYLRKQISLLINEGSC